MVDAMLGVRYLGIENKPMVGSTSVKKKNDNYDLVLVLRPSLILFKERLNRRLRFYPTL